MRLAPAGPWRAAFTATCCRPADTGWAELHPAIQRELRDVLAAADPLQLAAWADLEKNEGSTAALGQEPPAIPTRGRTTAYGYPNGETPDRNSSDGIGAWVSTAEAARITAG